MKENLKELFTGLSKILENFNLSTDEFLTIQKRLKGLHLKKGDFFCRSGKHCDKVGILISGLLMANFETAKGKSNISRFFYSPDNIIVTSFESFKSKRSADENIIAIEDSTLLYFNNEDLEILYETVPAMNKISRIFAEESYIAALRRIHDLQVLNNQERIEKFFTKQNGLFNRVSKKDIASYLRVNRNDLTKEIARVVKKVK